MGIAAIGLAWQWPQAWDLALIYLHPLMALWFLDREIGRNRPRWRTAYRRWLALLPPLLLALWGQLWNSPPLPGDDALTVRIAAHAGAGILDHVSSHLLVATHVFLRSAPLRGVAGDDSVGELAHAAVAYFAGTVGSAIAHLATRRSAGVLVLGAAVVVLFWAGFLADYPLTRDIYFTVALGHVLAEVPFLLRLL